MEATTQTTQTIQLKGVPKTGFESILTPEALSFIAELHDRFNERRLQLLEARKQRQNEIDAGQFPDFLPATKPIREENWTIEPVPTALEDRRVEITGPVDRKMIINALNSGANVYMADFEDSTSPTWTNLIEGHINLKDAVRRSITFRSPEGKEYRLHHKIAVLTVRPRGWHLDEAHLLVGGEPVSASLFDFGLFCFHNATTLAERNEGPFFYLPKLESHEEARLWNEVFTATENTFGLSQGTIRATVLIETITAAFEMDEILYELREHAAGLNAGRWDYIFSIIKKFQKHNDFILPDRGAVTMEVPFMKAYAEQLVKVCHRRKAHAIGGMSAFIPSKDETINRAAFAQVSVDKEREASQGYDGTWVAHPGLVSLAREEFDKKLSGAVHQKHQLREDVSVSQADLLNTKAADAAITEKGFRANVNVALLYLDSWLSGTGAAALYNLMEDAATAEISRAQLWQWITHRATLEDGRAASEALYQQISEEEFEMLRRSFERAGKDTLALSTARFLLDGLVLNKQFDEFLTLKAYPHIQ